MTTENTIVFPEQTPDPARVAYLIAGYINDTLTDGEQDELDEWVSENDENMKLFEELTDEKTIGDSLQRLSKLNQEDAYRALTSRIRKEGPSTGINRRMLLAIAASVLVIVAAYFIYRSTIEKPDTGNTEWVSTDDIAPGGNHATLSVAGKVTDLSKVSEGLLVTADDARLEVMDNGLVKYAPGAYIDNRDMVHTLATPRGGQYSIILEDGTRVWLNASSSLTYPAFFSGDRRIVQLTGEGYFEVAKSEKGKDKIPFIVQAGDMEVTVTGTAFNINAYPNEPFATATLVEGAVVVHSKSGSISLTAGEQALVAGEKLELNKPGSVSSFVAWKNNQFEFRNADIQTIMRQLERWYNAEVVYNGIVKDRFNATINRDVPVSRLLHYLQLTDRVYFEIKDNTIFVNTRNP